MPSMIKVYIPDTQVYIMIFKYILRTIDSPRV